MACESKALVGVYPAAVSIGSASITLGSFKAFVVENTDADNDGNTIGSPQVCRLQSSVCFVAFIRFGGAPHFQVCVRSADIDGSRLLQVPVWAERTDNPRSMCDGKELPYGLG